MSLSIMSKAKASWDMQTTKLLIDLCLEQVQNGERKGSSMTKLGWKCIREKFYTCTGREYSQKQFKNKYDSLRKDWQTWKKLESLETGLGWNGQSETVGAEDEWWEQKILENPLYEKFRFKKLQFSDELERLFNDVAASGACHWAPSTMTIEPGGNQGYGNDEGVDLEEGFGDSDDVPKNLTGIGGELNKVTFNASLGNIGEASVKGPMSIGQSLGVRKAGGGKKKVKGTVLSLLVEYLGNMINMRRAEIERANQEAEQARVEVLSLAAVMTHLRTVEEVMQNKDFFRRCTNVLRSQENREIYGSFKDDPELLLEFLHEICYVREK